MLDEPPGGNPRHRDVCVMDAPLTVEAEGKRQGFGCVATAGLLYRHLRHTCVTELSDAGATPQQIRGVTGHSLATINEILQIYLVVSGKLADGAMRLREEHYAKAEEGK